MCLQNVSLQDLTCVLFAAFTEEKLFHRNNCNCQGIMHIFLFSKFTVANLLGPSLVASIKSIFKRNKPSFLSPRKQSKILNYFKFFFLMCQMLTQLWLYWQSYIPFLQLTLAILANGQLSQLVRQYIFCHNCYLNYYKLFY